MPSVIFLNQSSINIGDTVCKNFNFRNIQSQFAINHDSEQKYVLSNNLIIYDQIVSSSKIIDLKYTDSSFLCEIPETPTPTPTETTFPTYPTETTVPTYLTETTVPTYPTETPTPTSTPTPTETPTPTPTYSCCTAFYVPDDYQQNKDQFGDGCLEPGFMDVGDGCRYIITLDNCDECDAHAALPDSWPPGLTWECIPSSDCGEFIPDDPP